MSRYRIITNTTEKTRTIEEALKLTDQKEIEIEIEIRKKQIQAMVGWLYPSILRDEIEKLTYLYNSMRNSVEK